MTEISMKEIVSMALDEAGKSIKDFDKFWIFGFRGLQDIEQNFAAEPKSVRIPKNGNQTVSLPSDYIAWSKIGILNNDGEVSTLKTNTGLSLFADTMPSRIQKNAGQINDSVQYMINNNIFFNYYSNNNYYNLFGIGGGLVQYGEFRMDEPNNLIVLNENFPYDSIILEYLSCPNPADKDYCVKFQLREALIAFILWKARFGTAKEYYDRCTEARRRLKKVTLQEIAEVIREANGFYMKA